MLLVVDKIDCGQYCWVRHIIVGMNSDNIMYPPPVFCIFLLSTNHYSIILRKVWSACSFGFQPRWSYFSIGDWSLSTIDGRMLHTVPLVKNGFARNAKMSSTGCIIRGVCVLSPRVCPNQTMIVFPMYTLQRMIRRPHETDRPCSTIAAVHHTIQ